MAAEPASETVLRIRDSLQACTQSLDSNNTDGSNNAIASLIQTLNSLFESSHSNDETFEPNHNLSEQVFDEMLQYLSDSKNQILIDALSFEIPKIAAKFGVFTKKSEEIANKIIKLFVSNCNPRDLISILCEALNVKIEEAKSPVYYIILLDGLAQVLSLIQRRHIEQLKTILPVILNILHNIPFISLEEENYNILNDLFKSAIQIGISIQEICTKMDDKRKKELVALLGLYILEIIAIISKNHKKNIISSCTLLILELSKFIPFCEFSYFGLITGSNINSAINEISKDDCDEFINCFSLSNDGPCLAVIWGFISEEIAKSTGEDLNSVLKIIQKNKIEIWQAIDMLKYPLSSLDYSFEIKNHILDFLINILSGYDLAQFGDNNNLDFSSFLPSVFVTIQGIQRIMMSALDPNLRKKAFVALKKIISAIPIYDRFDILKALITNSTSPSMTALLIDIARQEILEEIKKDGNKSDKIETQNESKNLNLCSNALNLVEVVLKPSEGGPPIFPENSEPVLAALNLLRFILITESSGESSGDKLLTKEISRKIYNDWLLPLRTLVLGITRENLNEFEDHLICALNPVQLVLYRCIELVEDSMKN